MKTLFGRDALAATEQGSAVTIGTFDGVHVGHRALIARTLDAARAQELESVVVTWDRHPAATLRPDSVPPLLTTPERKVELIQECGVDTLAILPFDRELSSWPPERFVEEVLVSGLGARAVVVGEGWRFGRKATGDVALLRRLGPEIRFSVEALALTEVAGGPASSTRARDAVAAGDMELVRAVLGRPFDLDGEVVRGDDRGVALGFPTANIAIDEAYAHPPTGVYAGRAVHDEEVHSAAINVGVNPTFGGDEADVRPRIEAYLLDFSGDLYGRVLRVEFHKRLRDERKFDSVEGLIDQIARDVEATRSLVRR